MKIRLTNEIDLGGQMEVVDQIFPVDVTEKAGKIYLVYTNDEGEKVILKCDAEEMTMTRYSEPKTVMRFHRDQEMLVALPTPMGMQYLVTDTKTYSFEPNEQNLSLSYDLKQEESNGIFASYQLEISWG
ncbi:DUF1934 domain-containing protein [Streptococcus caprae]|uniref:DUF1934 domain-containing protein n=1 Tax=Streptococcus caprae TaxID=1640501 RepID=A0ABV8CWU2_9STRE